MTATTRRVRSLNEKEERSVPSFIHVFCNFFQRFIYIIWKLMKFVWYWIERIFLVILILSMTIGLAWWLSQKPSLYRDWETQDSVLPTITWSGETVNIRNIRNHTWISSTEFTP